MGATLQLTRTSRLADAARPYQIVLDGEATGEIRNDTSTELPIAAETHTLQIRLLKIVNRRPGLASPTMRFKVDDGGTAKFICQPPSYPQAAFRWIACLLGGRDQWIELESTTDSPPAELRRPLLPPRCDG